MPSLARGESSSQANPVLDIWTALGNPPVLTDIAVLEFQIYDISTPAKKGSPVQVYPTTPGAWEALDPLNDAPTGHRLGVGHYYAAYTVPVDEPLGDHKIVWRFQHTSLSPYEALTEEFYVSAGALALPDAYCGISDVRAEGFPESSFSDDWVLAKIYLASKYVDKVTGRWFTARTFADPSFFKADGKESRTLHLEIPIIRLDRLYIENQGLVQVDPTEIDLDAVRVYNRHLTGMTQPDDRENPRISFLQTRFYRITTDGLFPPPRIFPLGRQNVLMEGVFGYTDPDGSTFGETPRLIRQATCRLVTRDLLLDSRFCSKLEVKQRFRIIGDKEGTTNIRLEGLWLKGAFTGDSEIDNILMAYKRPPRIAVA